MNTMDRKGGHGKEHDVKKMVTMLTVTAWVTLGIGLLLSLFNLQNFNDKNSLLMIGIGFMEGSVFIYLIRTGIHLVHKRALEMEEAETML